MNVTRQIDDYIAAQPERKRQDLQALHGLITSLMPGSRLWFLDGRDEQGRIVSNPSIGYGVQAKTQAGGRTREFYQVGISANSAGISVYIMGLPDRAYLPATYGASLGKATVTGYCIKFRALDAINLEVLATAIRDGVAQRRAVGGARDR